MTQVIGFVGTNQGFALLLRHLRKLAMQGATFGGDQQRIDRAARDAKMRDVRGQYRPNPAA